jgi:hypothetical protein
MRFVLLILGFTWVVALLLTAGVAAQDATQKKPADPARAHADAPTQSLTDIHEIKPLEPAGFDPRMLYLTGALALAAGVVGALLLLWHRRRMQRRRLLQLPSLSPEQTALTALRNLEQVSEMSGKAFYFALSSIVRYYLHQRFQINAPEMTLEELIPALMQAQMDPALKQRLKQLFIDAAPIQYADTIPADQQMAADLQFVRGFVHQTTPAPEA